MVRSRQLTLGNVTFAHGPHIVARAAPRLKPAQSTLHMCCGIRVAELLSAAISGGPPCHLHAWVYNACNGRKSYLVTCSGGTLLMSFHALRMLFLCPVVLVTELKALKNPWCACHSHGRCQGITLHDIIRVCSSAGWSSPRMQLWSCLQCRTLQPAHCAASDPLPGK